jgi:hypothetical protein
VVFLYCWGTPPIFGWHNRNKKKSVLSSLLYSSGSPTPTTTAMTTMAGEKENVDNVHKHQHKVLRFFFFGFLLWQQKGKFLPRNTRTTRKHTEKALNPGDFSVCGRRESLGSSSFCTTTLVLYKFCQSFQIKIPHRHKRVRPVLCM